MHLIVESMHVVLVIMGIILFSSCHPSADIATDATGQNQVASFSNDTDWLDTWEAPARLRDLMPYYVSGHDFDGLTVYVMEFGGWRYVQLAELPEKDQEIIAKYFDQAVSRMVRDSNATGNDEGVVSIIDWDGFTLANFASSKALQLTLKQFTYLHKFVTALGYGFQINSNFAAKNFLNIAKPFLGNVLEKYEIYGTQAEKWKPQLLSKVPADQLSPKYGGKDGFKPLRTNGKWK